MFSSLRNRVALSKSKTNSKENLAKSKTTKTKASTNRYKKHTTRIEVTSSSSSSSSSSLLASSSVNKENILNKIDEEEVEKLVDSKYTSSSSVSAALSKDMSASSKINNITCSSILTDPFNKLKIESSKSSVAVAAMFSPTNQQQQAQQQATKYSEAIAHSPDVSPRGRFADECEYRMNHPKRGIAVIINNKRFDPRLEMVSNKYFCFSS